MIGLLLIPIIVGFIATIVVATVTDVPVVRLLVPYTQGLLMGLTISIGLFLTVSMVAG